MKIENHTILTKEKDEAAALYFWKKDLYRAFAVLLIFLGVIFIIEVFTGNDLVTAIINLFWNITFLFVLLGAVFLALRKKTTNQINQSYTEKDSFPIHYTFEDEIHVKLGKKHVTFTWNEIRFIAKVEDGYYLKTKQSQMYLIENCGFTSDEAHKAFLSSVAKHHIEIK